jgi:hypothetical protein
MSLNYGRHQQTKTPVTVIGDKVAMRVTWRENI